MFPNIKANWSAPSNVIALMTKRKGGISQGHFASNNVGLHVGDCSLHVEENRKNLRYFLPSEPTWLTQTHSSDVIIVEKTSNRCADAAITREKNRVLAIMTADCLPILLCDHQTQEIAAIHAGWRGLLEGVISQTLKNMATAPHQLMAWIGPGICADCFLVGEDVYSIFIEKIPFSLLFLKKIRSKWKMDLIGLAEKILIESGILSVYRANLCTFEKKNEFYSYRREKQTGRMVSLIWISQ